jgi:hypothetical protein
MPPISALASRSSPTQNPIVPLMPGGSIVTLDGAPQGSGIAPSGQPRPGEAAAVAPGAAAAATASSTSGTEAKARAEHAKARFRAGSDDDEEEEAEEGGVRQQRRKGQKGATKPGKPKKAQAKKAQAKKAQVGEAKAKAKAKPAKKGPKYPPYQDFITRLAAVLKPPADFNRGKSKVHRLRIVLECSKRSARRQTKRSHARQCCTGRAGWQPSSARANAKHNLP